MTTDEERRRDNVRAIMRDIARATRQLDPHRQDEIAAVLLVMLRNLEQENLQFVSRTRV